MCKGGYTDECKVQCNNDIYIESLMANHEEADTRLILHSVNTNADHVTVYARDTDVLLFLLSHYDKMNSDKTYMMAGTLKKPTSIPVHDVAARFTQPILRNMIAFHALTGSDTTSYIAGHFTKTAFDVYNRYWNLLEGFGEAQLNDRLLRKVEEFVCHIYGITAI